ncbi:MAG: F0F1 ATP synthase subunit B [Oscillospiraceae bacterium]
MNASILDIGWPLLFTILNFLILLFFLNKFLFGPVNDMLDKRKNEIEGNLENAEQEKNAAYDLKSQYTEKIKEARNEAEEVVKTATLLAAGKSDSIIEEAKARAKKIEEKANLEIESQKRKAFDDIKSEISVMAIAMASKVIEKDMTEVDHDKLINQFIDGVGEEKWQV